MSASRPEPDAPEPQPPGPNAGSSLRVLFIEFLRLGATAFGGPAMVVYIRQLAVDRKGWLTARTFDDGVALCQAVPGATAMQTAAYVGLSVRGVAGAAVSFMGFGLPAFSLMLGLSIFYEHTHKLPAVVLAFSGLQAIVVAMVANAAVTFGRTTLKNWRHLSITILAATLFGWGINPFFVVVLAAFAGCLFLKEQSAAAPTVALARPCPPTWKPALLILGPAAALLAGLFFAHRPLYDLATMMVRVDLFAFGGGFASVPLLFNEVVTARHLLDGSTLSDGIVLGQVTPGPIVMTATFVGYLLHGIFGAIVATVAVFLPSFLIVIAVAPHFDRLRSLPGFSRLISGALCSFPGLLLIVTAHFAQSVNWDIARLLLVGAAFVALRLGANIFWVVVGGTAFALTFCR